MMLEEESGEGEELPDESDYHAIPELDRYEEVMLDDRPRTPSSRRELTARQRAEEVMSARDAQERPCKPFARFGAVALERTLWGGGSGDVGSTRGPRALEQVKANRASNLELERLGAALKCPDAVVAKAEGYLRKAYTGARCLSNGPQLASLPAACLEIAARVCKKPISRDVIMRKAGVAEKDIANYTRAVAHCHCLLGEWVASHFAPPGPGRNLPIGNETRAPTAAYLLHAFVAGIRREVSVAELCTEFKCNGIKTSIRQTLEAFKRQFWASLPESRREDADFSRLPSLHV